MLLIATPQTCGVIAALLERRAGSGIKLTMNAKKSTPEKNYNIENHDWQEVFQ